MNRSIEQLVLRAKEMKASDIHLICGLPPKMRIDGNLENMTEDTLTREECVEYAAFLAGEICDGEAMPCEIDLAASYAGNRCRIHIFRQQGVPSIAIRLLREEIPDINKLGLPPAAADLIDLRKGIVLITGETGSGKSTTLAALIDGINHKYKKHIVTLEDPIEYIYRPDLCAINQREVGKDTASFAEGLRASLREDPDVILIGEMRDRDTIETAITAAETGHLVFGTLHTGTAADSIDRIVQVFDEGMQQEIRMQLSTTLMAVLTQQLIPRKSGGRVLVSEYMIVTDAIRNLIRGGNTPQIVNAIATSAAIGGQTMDQDLARNCRSGRITKETALHYAHDPAFVKKNSI